MNMCKGINCGCTDGVSHSLECHAEHAASIAGGVFVKSEQAAASKPKLQCRTDGRCQYAIEHGAEGLGHCPPGKCAMPEPQAQAGEPEVVAWRYYLEKGQGPLHHAQEENAKMFSFDGTAEPLITLQSHREVMTEKQRELEVSRELQDRATEAMVELEDKANRVSRYHHERTIQLAAANETIAKKDAALKACVEAHAIFFKQYPHMQKGYMLDAITQAQEALK